MPRVRRCELKTKRNQRILIDGEKYMMEEEVHAVQEEHRFSPPSYSPFEINSVSSFNTSMFNNGGANVIEHDSIKAQSVDGAPKVGDSQNAEILDDQSNDGTTDISAQIQRITNTIQRAANETTFCQSDNTTQNGNATIGHEGRQNETHITSVKSPQQRTKAFANAESNVQAQNSENALLKYFRKYNGATGNGNTNEGSTAADTFRSCISGAGMEPNFFSARMVTDETVTSGVFNTGRSRCHNTMFTSINDKGNPFTKFAAPPYSSKLRSWSNQANNNATLRDEQSNPFCAASGNRKANQAGGALKDGNKKTASPENPFRKVVPMRHATQSILETSHDRGVARLDGFARYVVEKEKALEAMRRMEERENNSFFTNDTTFIRKRQSLVHREPARLQYRSKRSSLTNPPLQKRRGGKRMNERNCAGQRRLHSVVKCKNDIRLHNEQNAKVTEDSLFMIMDARTIRTCPICGIPVLGVVSHYRKSHGDWNGKERNKYFMRERIRILRCALGRKYLKSKLTRHGLFNEKTIAAITEILEDCGVSVEEDENNNAEVCNMKKIENSGKKGRVEAIPSASFTVRNRHESCGTQTMKSLRASCVSEQRKKRESTQTCGNTTNEILNNFSFESAWISVDDVSNKLSPLA